MKLFTFIRVREKRRCRKKASGAENMKFMESIEVNLDFLAKNRFWKRK
jgi:hypothetical protein